MRYVFCSIYLFIFAFGCTDTMPNDDCIPDRVICSGLTRYVCVDIGDNVTQWVLTNSPCKCSSDTTYYENISKPENDFGCQKKICIDENWVDGEKYLYSCAYDQYGKLGPHGKCINGKLMCGENNESNRLKFCTDGVWEYRSCESCSIETTEDGSSVSCAQSCELDHAECLGNATLQKCIKNETGNRLKIEFCEGGCQTIGGKGQCVAASTEESTTDPENEGEKCEFDVCELQLNENNEYKTVIKWCENGIVKNIETCDLGCVKNGDRLDCVSP